MSDQGTYDFNERGDYSAQDVRLYRFTIGTVKPGYLTKPDDPQSGQKQWAYTGNDRDVTWNGTTYTALGISDDGLKQKGDATSDDFVITVPSSIPLVQMFRGTPPSLPVKAELRMLQMGGVGGADAPLAWFGYVSSVKYKDEIASSVLCNTQAATLNRKGLRLAWERQCPHALYDNQCRVNKVEWGIQATITELSNNWFAMILPFAAQTADGGFAGISAGGHDVTLDRFLNGFVEWTTNLGYTERRAILTPYQGGFVLLGLTDGLAIGTNIRMYPGCARTPFDCKKFDNIENYGGFAFLPGKSPFDGDPVW